MDSIAISPVGIMHCGLKRRAETPRNFDISKETGVLEIYPKYIDAMDGIKAGQTMVVLFWLHQAQRDLFKVYPRGDRSRGLQGVFATRSPMRPNPIALSELKVLEITERNIIVFGVDVLDETPILDIKKKM